MRLFVAINFPQDVKKVLLDAIENLRVKTDSGKYTKPENLHLTLVFIGETRNIAAAKDAVDAIVAAPFDITVGESGRFGDVFWAGVKRPHTELSALHLKMRTELRNRGFELDNRAFRPHVTLVRGLGRPLEEIVEIPATKMTVGRISLMKSERINGILQYSEIYGRSLRDTE